MQVAMMVTEGRLQISLCAEKKWEKILLDCVADDTLFLVRKSGVWPGETQGGFYKSFSAYGDENLHFIMKKELEKVP